MPPKRINSQNSTLVKNNSSENLSLSELKLRVRALKKQKFALDKEINQLKEEGVSADLKPEMQALQDYNDIKDAAQIVFGYLADVEHCTVTELHKRYNLPLK